MYKLYFIAIFYLVGVRAEENISSVYDLHDHRVFVGKLAEEKLAQSFFHSLSSADAEALFGRVLKYGICSSKTIPLLVKVLENAQMLEAPIISFVIGALLQAKELDSSVVDVIIRQAEKKIITGHQRFALLHSLQDILKKRSYKIIPEVIPRQLRALAGSIPIEDTHSHLAISKALLDIQAASREDVIRFFYAVEAADESFWKEGRTNIATVLDITRTARPQFPPPSRMKQFFRAVYPHISSSNSMEFQKLMLDGGVLYPSMVSNLVVNLRVHRVGNEEIEKIISILKKNPEDKDLQAALKIAISEAEDIQNYALESELRGVLAFMERSMLLDQCVISFQDLQKIAALRKNK